VRAARWFVLASALAGIGTEMWLGSREWPLLQWLPLVLFLAFAAIARVHEGLAFALPLSVALIVPVLFVVWVGHYFPAYLIIWFAAMLGAAIGARGSWRGWSLPSAWVLPLGLWAMVVAVGWPIVIAREADFTAAWLTRIHHMANSNVGGPPPIVAVWVLTCALTLFSGLLWFDRLFAYANDPVRFRRWVLAPISIGAFVSAMLGIYQGLFDVSFLNGHQWPELRRAGGGLIDADGFGAGAGFFSAIFVAIAASGGAAALALGALGALVSWGGLWASGSRMALAAGLIGAGGIAVASTRAMLASRRRWPFVAGAVVLVIAAALVVKVEWSTASPIARSIEDLPSPNLASLKHFAKTQLFDRGAPYGTATVWMFRQSPLVGVGIGTFNGVFPDYSLMIVGARFSFDNAQSWYRQQFAEMGLLGVAGWLWWLATVAWLLVRTSGTSGRKFSATVVKGALVALALVTAVSLPTQNWGVALIPWLLVFWYLLLSPDARARLDAWPAAGPVVSGLVVWGGALAFAALTFAFGVREYRPSMRAVWANWQYTAGFYDVEGARPEEYYQWTEGHAVHTVPVRGNWMKLTIAGGPEDIEKQPVRLTISRRYRPIIDIVRSSPKPLTYYIAAGAERQMIIGVDTSRTFQPSDTDRRQLGVRISDWEFVDAPPPGANVIR